MSVECVDTNVSVGCSIATPEQRERLRVRFAGGTGHYAVSTGEVRQSGRLAARAEGRRRSAEPGRAIDHLGWRAPEIDAKIDKLKQKGVQVTGEPRDVRDLRVAFVEDPSKVRIELVRRPAGK